MSKNKVYAEMEELLGVVPSMFREMPESTLALEWDLYKKIQLDDGPISNKNRELIGLGISAATKCQYCIFYHTELAKLFGASEEEIEAAVHYAKATSGWSTYVNGLQIDIETFESEIRTACAHVAANTKKVKSAA